eukprot:scpid98653/ scgid0638/ 
MAEEHHGVEGAAAAAVPWPPREIVMKVAVNTRDTVALFYMSWIEDEPECGPMCVLLSRHKYRIANADVRKLTIVLDKLSTALSHSERVLEDVAFKGSLQCKLGDLDGGGLKHTLCLGSASLFPGVGALKQTVCDAVFRVYATNHQGGTVVMSKKAVYTVSLVQLFPVHSFVLVYDDQGVYSDVEPGINL